MCVCCCCFLVTQFTHILLWPHGLQPTKLLYPCDFPVKNTGVGCHFLLQESFPTQGSNSHLFALVGGFFIIEPPGKPIYSDTPPLLFIFNIYLFIYFWLSCLVQATLLRYMCFSLQWILSLHNTGSSLQHMGLAAPWHVFQLVFLLLSSIVLYLFLISIYDLTCIFQVFFFLSPFYGSLPHCIDNVLSGTEVFNF